MSINKSNKRIPTRVMNYSICLNESGKIYEKTFDAALNWKDVDDLANKLISSYKPIELEIRFVCKDFPVLIEYKKCANKVTIQEVNEC